MFFNSIKPRSLSEYEQLANDCSILFCKSKKILEFRRSYAGICANKGWYEPLKRLCCRLEALNIQYYQKYGIRIQAEQVKEKFGTLRFYYRVVHDDNGFSAKLSNCFYKINKWLKRNIDFKMKTVVDQPSFNEYLVQQMDDNEFISAKVRWKNCVNVWFEELDNDVKVVVSELVTAKVTHQVPTRHKLFFKLRELAWSIHTRLQPACSYRDSEISVIADKVDADANDLVKAAENECYHLCEECGAQIRTEWSPVCTTCGWVSYICSRCAEASKRQYYMNGALYSGKECIKTKEQIEKEQPQLRTDDDHEEDVI